MELPDLIDDYVTEERQLNLLSAGAALVAAFIARKLVQQWWASTHHNQLPIKKAHHDAGLKQALIMGGLMGLVMGISRVAAQRSARAGWRKLMD